jgi:hypothetical protein
MSADDVVVLFCLGRAATSELRQESRKAVQIKVKAFFITGNYSKAKSGCSGSHSFLLVGEAGVHLQDSLFSGARIVCLGSIALNHLRYCQRASYKLVTTCL